MESFASPAASSRATAECSPDRDVPDNLMSFMGILRQGAPHSDHYSPHMSGPPTTTATKPNAIDMETCGTPPLTTPSSSHRVELLSSSLRNSHQQQRRLMEQYRAEKSQLLSQLQKLERQLVEQASEAKSSTQKQLEEQRALFETERARVHAEYEQMLVAATQQAVAATHECQRRLAGWTAEKERWVREHEKNVTQAVERVQAEAAATLERERQDWAATLKQSLEALEEERDMMEIELLEALDRNDDLETERDDKIASLKVEIDALQQLLANTERDLKHDHEAQLATIVKERDDAMTLASELSRLAAAVEEQNESILSEHSILLHSDLVGPESADIESLEAGLEKAARREDSLALAVDVFKVCRDHFSSAPPPLTTLSEPPRVAFLPATSIEPIPLSDAPSAPVPERHVPVAIQPSIFLHEPSGESIEGKAAVQLPSSNTDDLAKEPSTSSSVTGTYGESIFSPPAKPIMTTSVVKSPNSAFESYAATSTSDEPPVANESQQRLNRKRSSTILSPTVSSLAHQRSKSVARVGKTPETTSSGSSRAGKATARVSRLAAPKSAIPARGSIAKKSSAAGKSSKCKSTSAEAVSPKVAAGDRSTAQESRSAASRQRQSLPSGAPSMSTSKRSMKAGRGVVTKIPAKQKSLLPQFGQRKTVSSRTDLYGTGNPLGGPVGPRAKEALSTSRTTQTNVAKGTKTTSSSTIPPTDEKSKRKEKTSPTLIKNVLKSLSPDSPAQISRSGRKSVSTPPSIPAETIETTPTEDAEEQRMFDSLFADWSTAKKEFSYDHRVSENDSDGLPSNLSFAWSTVKKAGYRTQVTQSGRSSKKRTMREWDLETPARATNLSERWSAQSTSQKGVRPNEVQATPLFVRSELVDVLSPEELLLSPPTDVPPQSVFRSPPPECNKKYENSALMVQAIIRGRLARRTVQQHIGSVVMIQSLVRSALGRQSAKTRLEAVLTIQAFLRMHLCRNAFEAKRRAAYALQACYRGHRMRVRFADVLKAVTTIQSIARRSAKRQKFENNRMSCLLSSSSLLVQTRWRMHRDRQYLASARASSIAIQAAVRACLGRSSFMSTVRRVIILQATARTYIARSAFRKAKASAIHLQAVVRGQRARVLGQVRRGMALRAAIFIQDRWRAIRRGRADRMMARQRLTAGVIIQAAWKSFASRRIFVRYRTSAIKIQTIVRRSIVRMAYGHTVHAIGTLQSIYRGYSARREFKRKRESTVAALSTIQTIYRGYKCRQNIAQLMSNRSFSAIMVQKTWRGVVPRQTFMRNREAAIAVQKMLRGAATRAEVALRLRKDAAGVILQRTYRKYAAQTLFAKSLAATVTLQSVIRRALAIRRTTDVKRILASVTIQRLFRGAMQRQAYVRQLESVVRLQSVLRRFLAMRHVYEIRCSLSAATMLQRVYRSVVAQRNYRACLRSTALLQAISRGFLARHRYEAFRCRVLNAAETIQRIWRGTGVRERFKTMALAATLIQSTVRRYMAYGVTVMLAKEARSVLVIQRAVRSMLARCEFVSTLGAVVLIQKHWRGHRIREYQKQEVVTKSAPAALVSEAAADPALTVGSQRRAQPSTKKFKRAPLGTVPAARPATVFSPLKTRRGAKVVSSDSENGTNRATRNKSKPVEKEVPAAKVAVAATPSRSMEEIEKMKVVELRELLLSLGMEKKELRNLRKANLVSLVMEKS